MINKSLFITFIFISIFSFSQEIDEIYPKDKPKVNAKFNFQELKTENASKIKLDQGIPKIIPIPTANLLNAELYTILDAPINSKYEYKMLNMFPEKSEVKEPNLVEK